LRSSRSHAACRATRTNGGSPRPGMNNMDPRIPVTRTEHGQSRLHRPATHRGNNEAGFLCPRAERAADQFVVRQRRRLPEPARRKEMPADASTCRGYPQLDQGRTGPGEGERDSSADPRHGEEGRAGIRGRVALKSVRKAWLRRVSRQPVRYRTVPAWPVPLKAAFPEHVKERFAAGERDRETKADFGIKTWFMNRACVGWKGTAARGAGGGSASRTAGDTAVRTCLVPSARRSAWPSGKTRSRRASSCGSLWRPRNSATQLVIDAVGGRRARDLVVPGSVTPPFLPPHGPGTSPIRKPSST